MKRKATFCDQLKHSTNNNAQTSVATTYSIIMINESNKRKIQQRLQRTAVSVITHGTYEIVLRKIFNETYVMHKIQRTQRMGQPHTTGTPTAVRGNSDQWKQTKQTLHTHNSTKKRKHTRRSF